MCDNIIRMGEFGVPVCTLAVFASFCYSLCSGLTYFYGDGSYFEGTVDMQGRPEEGQLYNSDKVIRYNGSFKDGLYHGNGSWYGERGHVYQGQFKYGKANGMGVWTTGGGERIEGQFLNHAVNGEAVWHWLGPNSTQLRLEGMFKRGHAHGEGIMYYGDGTRFEGEFKKGYPNGQGKLVEGANNTVIWAGSLNNGWPEGEITERQKKLFEHFHTHPLRNVYRPSITKDRFSRD